MIARTGLTHREVTAGAKVAEGTLLRALAGRPILPRSLARIVRFVRSHEPVLADILTPRQSA